MRVKETMFNYLVELCSTSVSEGKTTCKKLDKPCFFSWNHTASEDSPHNARKRLR